MSHSTTAPPRSYAHHRNAHLYAECVIALDQLARTIFCLPLSCLGCRKDHPADWWYQPVRVRGLYVPAAADDYRGEESKLSAEVVAQRARQAAGSFSMSCPGCCLDFCEEYELVHEVEVTSAGELVLVVHPNYASKVIAALREDLSTPVGVPITVEGDAVIESLDAHDETDTSQQ